MKTYFTLAVLIAATLALAGCGRPSAQTSSAEHASPVAGANVATRGVIGETARTVANGVTLTKSFTVPVMVNLAGSGGQALGVTSAFAFFDATRAGDLKVTAAEGKPSVYVGFPGPNLAHGVDPEHGIPLQAGWHRVDIECLSVRCIGVTATFDGEPVVPYAWPYPAITGLLQ